MQLLSDLNFDETIHASFQKVKSLLFHFYFFILNPAKMDGGIQTESSFSLTFSVKFCYFVLLLHDNRNDPFKYT
jgi:hypothetical protein